MRTRAKKGTIKNLFIKIFFCALLILLSKNLEAAKPVASDITHPAFNEDTETIIYLVYNDADNDKAHACESKSLVSVTETTACSCDVNGYCSIGITGFENYFGSASLQYRVLAGNQPSNWANINLTINSVNDPPVISEILDTDTDEDTPKLICFTVSNIESILDCTSTYLSASSGNTLLVKTPGIAFGGTYPNCTATITPESNKNGTTLITITVTDGEDEGSSSFTLTVNPVDDPPIANTMSVDNFNKGTESPYIILDYIDYDEDKATSCSLQNLTNVAETTPCSCADGVCTVRVTGTSDYVGAGSFDFNVTANSVTSNWALASFTIIDPDTPPTITAITDKTMNENDSIDVAFTVSNAACTSESLSMSSTNETIVPNTSVSWSGISPDCTATITPLFNQNGTPQITISVANISGSDSTSFILTILEVDDPPNAQDISPASFDEDTESIINLSYTDPEGDLASACSINSVNNVTVTTSCTCSGGGVCTVGVTGTQDYYGSASFTYSVIANGLESNSATANLTIINVNDAPTISTITNQITDEDISIDVNFTIGDIDNTLLCTSLYLSMDSSNKTLLPDSHVIWSGTAPNCSAKITSTKDNYGYADEVKIIVSDGIDSSYTSFSLTVNPVDDAPEAYDIYPPMLTMNTEKIIALSYFDAEDDLASSCSVSNLTNVTATTACTCAASGDYEEGYCRVGITDTLDFTGEGHFDFNVTANGKTSNSASTAKLLIDVTFMDGSLDTLFGTNGYFIHNSLAGGDEHDFGNRGIIHNGNIYVVGSSFNSFVQGRNMALWNVSSTGTLGGALTHNGAAGGSGFDEAFAIDKYYSHPKYFFYVFGVSETLMGDKNIAIWKVQEGGGTLDTTFNSKGYKTYDGVVGVTNSNDLLFDGFILSGNYLIATGASENSNGYYQMFLMKADLAGNLDYSFGGTGFASTGFASVETTSNDEFGMSVAVQSSGKYIILGESWENGDYKNVKIWRINVNGTLDTTFGTDGIYTLSASGSDSFSARGLHVDYDNNITVSGDRWDEANGIFRGYVLKLDTHGIPCATFGTNGYYETGTDTDESYTSVLVQADNYILVGGYEWVISGFDTYGYSLYETNLKVCRLTDTGSLDTSFGISGCETHDSAAGGNDWDYVNSLLFSEDHYSYVYAIGASYNANENYDMAIWSFE